jgi:hypothetical protein
MAEEIINRVANSKLKVFDLEDYYLEGKRSTIDIKDWLEHELILREKDFRTAVKTHDWSQYKNHYLALHCSNDAIVPNWAYMLITLALKPFAKHVAFGSLKDLETELYQNQLAQLDLTAYIDKPVIIKGCSHKPVPKSAFIMATNLLETVAKTLMFGEACSFVPLYKRSLPK